MKKIISAVVTLALAAAMSTFVMTASADTMYTLPVDDIEAWQSSTDGSWSGALAESTYMNGEASADGMKIWPTGQHPYGYPNARVEDTTGANGIVTLMPDYYLNFDIKFEGTDSDCWQMKFNFGAAATASVDPAIVKAAGVEAVNNHIPAGEYKLSIKVSDLLKGAQKDNGEIYDDDQLYDLIFGPDGQPKLIGVTFVIYGKDTSDALTIKNWTITTEAETGSGEGTASVASTASTASTTSTASTASTASTTSKSSTAGGSSKTQVGTGEDMLPIIGIAALAVVATSAVVVTKKRAK